MSNNIAALNSKGATCAADTETFHFQNIPIRVVRVKGAPWFVAADVCKVLELKDDRGSYGYHLKKLDKNEVTPISATGVKLGGKYSPDQRLIAESGLYKLVLRSDKKTAKPFQNWVTQVVLPSIRIDGGYILGEEKVATGEMSEEEFLARAVLIGDKKIKRLQNALNNAHTIIEDNLLRQSVSAWATFNRVYPTRSQKTRLGQIARSLCQRDGIALEKQWRTLINKDGERQVPVGIYPKTILDEAALIVGLRGTFSVNLGISA